MKSYTKKKYFKIFLNHWIIHLWALEIGGADYFYKIVIEDQLLPYSWGTSREEELILPYGHSFQPCFSNWELDKFEKLPPWYIALLVAEPPLSAYYTLGVTPDSLRFPRHCFGHEFLHQDRVRRFPGYVHPTVRAVKELIESDWPTQVKVLKEVKRIQDQFPHTNFGGSSYRALFNTLRG